MKIKGGGKWESEREGKEKGSVKEERKKKGLQLFSGQ